MPKRYAVKIWNINNKGFYELLRISTGSATECSTCSDAVYVIGIEFLQESYYDAKELYSKVEMVPSTELKEQKVGAFYELEVLQQLQKLKIILLNKINATDGVGRLWLTAERNIKRNGERIAALEDKLSLTF